MATLSILQISQTIAVAPLSLSIQTSITRVDTVTPAMPSLSASADSPAMTLTIRAFQPDVEVDPVAPTPETNPAPAPIPVMGNVPVLGGSLSVVSDTDLIANPVVPLPDLNSTPDLSNNNVLFPSTPPAIQQTPQTFDARFLSTTPFTSFTPVRSDIVSVDSGVNNDLVPLPTALQVPATVANSTGPLAGGASYEQMGIELTQPQTTEVQAPLPGPIQTMPPAASQLDQLRETVVEAIRSMGNWPWILLGVAVFTILGEMARRRFWNTSPADATASNPKARRRLAWFFSPWK